MTATRTGPLRRRLTLSRETVRCLGGAPLGAIAVPLDTSTTLPAEPDDCPPYSKWCP